jgi:peptide/nickel transport system substrate-binding protein
MRTLGAKVVMLGLAGALALTAAACGSSSSSGASGGSTTSAGTPEQGGSATYAFNAGGGANYIFPVLGPEYFSTSNSQTFQWLMWRPLYWYGTGDTPSINDNLSVADEPTYSADGKTVTIHLKNYNWSDGTPVTARDVEFWENLVHADPADYAGSVPGGYPTNIVKTTIVNSKTIQFTTSKAYNTQWFLYNELSNITPMPQHVWDKTSVNGKIGNYDETTKGAKAVFAFLNGQAKKLSTYATNPLWKVVDGPWKLTAFDTNGDATFVPNAAYTGPEKPHLASFKEQSFTGTAAETNALLSGKGPEVGYISPINLSSQGRLTHEGYTKANQYFFEMSYTAINFNNPTLGPIFKQTYIRQALQEVVNEPALDKAYFGGIGYQTCGPVPIEPPNSFSDSYEKSCPYAWNPTKAAATLTAHGWKVVKNGVTTCQSPGTAANQCGAGIKAGAKLEFPYIYVTGGITFPKSMVQQKSDAETVGIKYDLKPETFNQSLSDAVPCTPKQAVCSWGLDNTAWVYSPDYYPSGEDLFQTGAGSNYGSYSDPTADKLIAATTLKSNVPPQTALNNYQDYLTNQIPVVWQGDDPQIDEVKTSLHGVTPFNVFGAINPEEWYYTK